MDMEEPRHLKGLQGRYWLVNDNVVVENISFSSKIDAVNWGNWANFGQENPFQIIISPSVKTFPRPSKRDL